MAIDPNVIIGDALQVYDSLEDFLAADEYGRRMSVEARFGDYWRSNLPTHRWEVRFISRTGEVYAHLVAPSPGPVLVLGRVPPNRSEDGGEYLRPISLRPLLGWEDMVDTPVSLYWVIAQMKPYRARCLMLERAVVDPSLAEDDPARPGHIRGCSTVYRECRLTGCRCGCHD